MQAIVTALDDDARQRIEDVLAELQAVLRLQLAAPPDAHIRHHLADAYDERHVDNALASVAEMSTPFDVETHGIGVARGTRTTLFLHVTASPPLQRLHGRIWQALAPVARDVKPAYAPGTWLPHVALAAGDVNDEQVREMVALLERRDFRWRLRATNVCLVPDVGSRGVTWRRFEFGAGA